MLRNTDGRTNWVGAEYAYASEKAKQVFHSLVTQAVGPSLAFTTNPSYARRTRTHGGATSHGGTMPVVVEVRRRGDVRAARAPARNLPLQDQVGILTNLKCESLATYKTRLESSIFLKV